VHVGPVATILDRLEPVAQRVTLVEGEVHAVTLRLQSVP
jgi:hypothetical protein